MHNVWTTIASRAPCVARPSRSKPLLELFNGYSRRSVPRWTCTGSREARRGSIVRTSVDVDGGRRCFSTTGFLSARARKPPPPPRGHGAKAVPRTHEASKVEAPKRAASHSEGRHAAEQASELTWRDYDPVGGMPLPGGELGQAEINAAFGTEELYADTGNYILSVMHWRRLSGALIDQQLTFPRDSGVSRAMAMRGLDYLRERMPDVPEEANGQQWAMEEEEKQQLAIRERAVKLKLYRPEEAEEPDDDLLSPPAPQQGTEEGRRRTGESVLETTRKAKEALYEQEQVARKAAEERAEQAALHSRRGPLQLSAGVQPDTQMILYGPGGISISAPQTKAWLQPVVRKPWVKYYEERAQILKDTAAPRMALVRRLAPSFLVLLAVLYAVNYLSENYTPPPKEARVWPDTPPSVATLLSLTAVLLGFFIANRIPPLWRTYSKFFTLVPAYPYAVSILGATFRHDTFAHLATNTATLWLMGLLLHEYVGRGTFLAVFFASGAIGGYTSLVYYVLRKQWASYVFGCSGAVLGVVSAVCTLRPHGKVVVAGYEVPVAAWVFLALWGGAELLAAWRFPRLGVDHAGHLGGLAGGFACAMWLRARARKEERRREGGEVGMVEVAGLQ